MNIKHLCVPSVQKPRAKKDYYAPKKEKKITVARQTPGASSGKRRRTARQIRKLEKSPQPNGGGGGVLPSTMQTQLWFLIVFRQTQSWRRLTHDPCFDMVRGSARLEMATNLTKYFLRCAKLLHPMDLSIQWLVVQRLFEVIVVQKDSNHLSFSNDQEAQTEQAKLSIDKMHPAVLTWQAYPEALELLYNATLKMMRWVNPSDSYLQQTVGYHATAATPRTMVRFPVFLGDPVFVDRCITHLAFLSSPDRREYYSIEEFGTVVNNPLPAAKSAPLWYMTNQDLYLEYSFGNSNIMPASVPVLLTEETFLKGIQNISVPIPVIPKITCSSSSNTGAPPEKRPRMFPPPQHYDGIVTTLTVDTNTNELDFWNKVKQNNSFQFMNQSTLNFNAQQPTTQNLLDDTHMHDCVDDDDDASHTKVPFSGSLSTNGLLGLLSC